MPGRRARERRVREDDARRGIRPDSVLTTTTGIEALAGTLLHRAVQANDRAWLTTLAARFWANVAGVRGREYERVLRTWLG